MIDFLIASYLDASIAEFHMHSCVYISKRLLFFEKLFCSHSVFLRIMLNCQLPKILCFSSSIAYLKHKSNGKSMDFSVPTRKENRRGSKHDPVNQSTAESHKISKITFSKQSSEIKLPSTTKIPWDLRFALHTTPECQMLYHPLNNTD